MTRRGFGRRILGGMSSVGAVVLVAAVATVTVSAAAYYDQANLNLTGDGIGSNNRFDIAVVLPDGTIVQADHPDGFDWAVPDAEELVPGHEVVTDIPVFNNSAGLGADVTLAVKVRNGDGSVGTAPNITGLLRFTAKLSDGTVLFADATLAGATASVGVLAKRGTEPLDEGDAYTPGDVGSEEVITLIVEYPNVTGVEDYNGGQSALALHLDAESVAP